MIIRWWPNSKYQRQHRTIGVGFVRAVVAKAPSGGPAKLPPFIFLTQSTGAQGP